MTSEQAETRRQMPRYKCHKEVWALKIATVEGGGPIGDTGEEDGGTLHFEDAQFAPKIMTAEYMSKHRPVSGGYYVRYPEGYESWSPADAFEAGYTKVEE